jgi:enoyl-CoA hydratase/carnithine racemase
MNRDFSRRRPPLADDVHAPSDEDTRRMSPQEMAASSGWTTTALAARALGVAQRTVQSYVQRGILEAKSEGEGVKKTLYISIDSLNALRARRIAEGKIGEHTPQDASSDQGADLAEVVQGLATRMADEAARAAALEARLELTERAESSLRAEVERERSEREQAQEEARRLREELEAERSKGFWRRLFGG